MIIKDRFRMQLVVDPATNTPIEGASFTVYDAADTGMTTPLAVTDMTDIPMTLTSGPLGIVPDFQVVGHYQVLIVSSDGTATPLDSMLSFLLSVLPDPSSAANGLALMTSDGAYVLAALTGDGSIIPAAAGQADGTSMEVSGGAWALGAKKAPVNNPVFTGDPKAPTPAPGDNDTSIATTAFVVDAISGKASTASPTFTGDPKAPTPSAGDNDTSIATTAFVQAAIASSKGSYVGINAQTGTTYSAVLTDVGYLVTLTNAGAITVTLPKDATAAVPVGARIDFVGMGAGLVSFVAESGATRSGTPGTATRAQYSAVSAVKVAANTWLLVGDLA